LRVRAAVAVCLAGLAAVSLHAQTRSRGDAQTSDRVAAALEQTGLTFRKSSDAVWIVAFKSSSSTAIDVIVNAQKDLVVVFAVVARAPQLSSEQLRDLLKASYSANFAKLAIDTDGDLLSLTEIATGGLTVEQLRTAIEEVATTGESAADLVRATVPAEEDIEAVPAGRGARLALVRGAFELTYDPAKWKPQPVDEANIVQLVHVSGDAYLKVIAERLEIDPGHLSEVAVSNAKSASPDVKVVTESWRTINGLRTLIVRLDGTTSGIRFSFYNQMYSDAAGTVQLAGWTGTNLFNEYRRDFLELFAGFRKLTKSN
jgi:hypothetical protein